MRRHLGWLAIIIVFCGFFTLRPALRGEVFGSLAPRDATLPFRASASHTVWKSRAAPELWKLARAVDATHARYGYFATQADPEGDLFYSVYPSYLEARRQSLRGKLPLWNERVLSGTPLMASSMVQPLSPFFWMALLFPPWTGFMVMLFAQALACSLSFYGTLVLRGYSSGAAAVAGLMVTFTGALLTFFPYGTVIGGFACVPWVVLALERLAQRSDRPRFGLGLLLSLAVAGQWIACNLQFAAYAALAELAWFAWSVFRQQRAGRLSRDGLWIAVAGSAVGFLLSAAQLLPVLEAIAGSGRDPLKYVADNRLHPGLLLTVPFPQLLGDAREGSFAAGMLWMIPPSVAYLLCFGSLSWCFVIAGTLRAGRTQLFWIALTYGPPLLFLLANVEVFSAMLAHLPGFSTSHALRALIVSSLGASLLVCEGIDGVLHAAPGALRGFSLALAMQLVIALGAWSAGHFVESPLALHLRSLAPSAYLTAILLCTLAFLAVPLSRRFGTRLGSCSIVALSCLELASHVSSRLPYVSADDLYAAPPIVEAAVQASNAVPGRLLGLTERDTDPAYQGDNLPPNVASVFGLYDARGFVPVPTLQQELGMAIAEDRDRPRHFPAAMTLTHLDSAWPERAGVRYVMTQRKNLPPDYRPLIAGETTGLYLNTRALPILGLVSCIEPVSDERLLARRAATEPWKGRLLLGQDGVEALIRHGHPVLACAPNQVVEAPRAIASPMPLEGEFEVAVAVPPPGAYLRIARTFVPGFRASIGATELPVLRADYAFQAVPLPPGSFRVRVRYEPESLRAGSRLSWVALALVALLGALVLQRRRTT